MGSNKVAVLVLGMAGSGKSTLMQGLKSYTSRHKLSSYFVNLDPAVRKTPAFEPNIDICDTVDYHELMKSTKMGPNGAIMTSLNLYATKFNEVLSIIESKDVEFVFIDTPGQIEVFTWSASGQLIAGALASSMPVIILYAIDTVRSASPVTFASNMLYACSVMYRLRLPIVLAFTKTDLVAADKAFEWISDPQVLADALQDDSRYLGSMSTSMAFMLESVYSNLPVAGVSAVTSLGMDDVIEKIREARVTYNDVFLPELEKAKQLKAEKLAGKAEEAYRSWEDDWKADQGMDF
ncbi:ATP-binding family protein [Carpediemonas membranifera]|uniref:GPN-loop GTPase n=1 Tax=Carpediemonas membranifera TaxID=201153 RepID=A0A8J6B5J7_9EUKA|nr:ATP-binding family protein [Carpediemonas membranifera]|eukprot:KAG9393317.1 ATP-binding family protein [Carpediemonas membranifera]